MIIIYYDFYISTSSLETGVPVLRSGGRQLLAARRPLRLHKWHSIRWPWWSWWWWWWGWWWSWWWWWCSQVAFYKVAMEVMMVMVRLRISIGYRNGSGGGDGKFCGWNQEKKLFSQIDFPWPGCRHTGGTPGWVCKARWTCSKFTLPSSTSSSSSPSALLTGIIIIITIIIIIIIIINIVVVQVATGSGLVDEELSALELGRNFHGCMRGLAIGQWDNDNKNHFHVIVICHMVSSVAIFPFLVVILMMMVVSIVKIRMK